MVGVVVVVRVGNRGSDAGFRVGDGLGISSGFAFGFVGDEVGIGSGFRFGFDGVGTWLGFVILPA